MDFFNLLTSFFLNSFCTQKLPLITTTTNQTLLNKQTNKQDFRVQDVPKRVISGYKNSIVLNREVHNGKNEI